MKHSVIHSRRAGGLSRIGEASCVCILAMALSAMGADVSGVKYGPPGSWVKPQFFSQSFGEPSDSSADERVLLQEQQYNAAQNEMFFHSDRQILTTAGEQNGSTITVDFNPAYQTLTFHWVRLWRGPQHLDRLDTNKVEVLQQEKDLDQLLLNGEQSAVLVLDDVRVGDVIDYAYSITGENPVSAGHFSAVVPVEMEEPAGRLLTRVLWPRLKPLYAKPHDCAVRPVTVVGQETVEYTWDIEPAPGITLEDSLPNWCDPEQWVQLSDFSSWAEVNQWAMALFQVQSPFSADLARKIAEWKQLEDPEQETLAALRFVQEDVRYFGIEMGTSAERPTDPSTVFARRFGDCKDKSLLFVSILRALGIEAWPVLVNATFERGIADWAPSAAAFDHCIAEVQCNGLVYWLDPTMNYQRGPLAAHYLPPYGYGLVIAPRTTGLTPIPQNTGLPMTTTTEYFQIGRTSEPSELKVVTVAEGRDADIFRELFATTKLGDIQSVDAHFYSEFYPGIKMSAPIVTQDDEEQDTFQITEFYTIDKIWTQSGSGKKFECSFYAPTMDALFRKPVNTDRKYPLGIDFPRHQILRTDVTLPDNVSFGDATKTISDAAFTFRKDRRCGGRRMVLKYEYESLSDSLSPDEVADHLQKLDECSQLLGETVYSR